MGLLFRKPFYGWVVCGIGTLLLFITMGTVSNGFSIYLPYIIAENGFTHAQGSFLVTLRCLVSFGAMLVIGLYYRKVGLRLGTFLAALCAGGAFFLYSLSHTYFSFCLGAALSGVSYGLGSMVPVSILINNWFNKRRTFALGICGCGSGIATIVLPPITEALITRLSVSQAFRVESIFILIATLLVLAFLRSAPSDLGLLPYGGIAAVEEGQAPVIIEEGRTLTRSVWLMMGGIALLMGALANPGLLHLPVLYTTEGMDSQLVALLISLLGIVLVVGKLLFGTVTDRIGGFASSLLFSGVLCAAHILLSLAFLQCLPLDVAAMLILGLGYPITTIGFSVWANDLVSSDQFPRVVQRLQVIYAAGALVFASFPGILADWLGSYVPTYVLFSALLVIVPFLIYFSYRFQNKARSA